MYLAHSLNWLTKILRKVTAITAIAVFGAQALGMPVIAQDVVISELMPDPVTISDTGGQWIELRNLTNTPQNINGWSLVIDNGTPATISAPTPIPAQGYFVICRSASVVDVNCDVFLSFSLGNDNTRKIELKNGSTEIDTVTYDATTDLEAGQSITVGVATNGDKVLNKDSTNTYSTDGSNTDYGTPGNVNADEIDPTVNINSPLDTSVVDNSFNVTGTAFDGQSGLKNAELLINNISVETVELENYQASFTFSNISLVKAGSYSVKVKATDHKGNTGYAEHNVTVANDSEVTVNSSQTADATPEISGSINNPSARVSVAIDGAIPSYPATNNGSSWVLADDSIAKLDDGMHTLTALATDSIGQTIESEMGSLLIDTTAPEVTINNLTTSNHSPKLTGTVDDALAEIIVRVHNQDYMATNHGDGTWSLSGQQLVPDGVKGEFTAKVTATDKLDNTSTDKATLTIVNVITATAKNISTAAASFVSKVTTGNEKALDSDGDGIPDWQDDTPYGDKDNKSEKSDSKKPTVASDDSTSGQAWRWIIFGAAVLAFLWFMLKARQSEE